MPKSQEVIEKKSEKQDNAKDIKKSEKQDNAKDIKNSEKSSFDLEGEHLPHADMEFYEKWYRGCCDD